MSMNELAQEAHRVAIEKGWYSQDIENPPDALIPAKLALIHAEVSEVLEAHRKRQGIVAFEEEVADVIIRILDLCGYLEIDIDRRVKEKMEKNRTRPMLHGGHRY